jgi:hydroxypyruvate isomerase
MEPSMKSSLFSIESSDKTLPRRTLLGGMACAAVLGTACPLANRAAADEPKKLKGRIKQSVCLWCFGGAMARKKMDLDQFAATCAEMGLLSIELVAPAQWPTLKKHGLICAMSNSHSIGKGLNRVENHKECLDSIRKSIDATSAAGFPNVICFSGNRAGMSNEEGMKNCATALKQILPYAVEKKVTVCMEFLNSIGHKDYMADSTKWCVELVHNVDSPRFKILYDIFHAAMMKEDVLADIKNHADCWGHYHTAGFPGRNEIDGTQKLDYPKLMQAIADSGYQGYVGQEFTPKNADGMKSLADAVALCDV